MQDSNDICAVLYRCRLKSNEIVFSFRPLSSFALLLDIGFVEEILCAEIERAACKGHERPVARREPGLPGPRGPRQLVCCPDGSEVGIFPEDLYDLVKAGPAYEVVAGREHLQVLHQVEAVVGDCSVRHHYWT